MNSLVAFEHPTRNLSTEPFSLNQIIMQGPFCLLKQDNIAPSSKTELQLLSEPLFGFAWAV